VQTRWLFLRLLGLVYLIAFLSLAFEITGLVGERGILPVGAWLADVRGQYLAAAEALYPREVYHGYVPPEYMLNAYRQYPTLLWLAASDNALRLLCLGGMGLAILVSLGIGAAPALVLAWGFYLSLAVGGQIFLGYQWDNLLLEVGFLAIWLAPWRLWPRRAKEYEPSRVVIWLLRLALFRLMFGSGIAKLVSGDPTWADLTALTYHYYTQPLPTPLAWYAHQLPLWFQHLSALALFAIEVGAPWLILMPWRRARWVGVGGIVALQVLILLTGNYTFFNWLTIILCIPALDDACLQRWLPGRLLPVMPAEPRAANPLYRRALIWPLAGVLVFVGVLHLLSFFAPVSRLPGYALVEWLRPFRSVNRYGLFAVMTTARREIVIEGSADGQTWQPYTLRYQPGDVNRPPPWIAPLQPRLDWQLWFAALGTHRQSPWFASFMQRLLEGSPAVLALLDHNPFPARPPRYIRALAADYHFTDWTTRAATGAWWARESAGEYFPVTALGGSG
jgi:hypothetical protein